MTLLLLMVLQISVAMGIGFILGRIWQIRSDLEEQLEVEERKGDPPRTIALNRHASRPSLKEAAIKARHIGGPAF